ncbi:fumarylacetoacetate hydrolase family protein [Acinetobacter baumannii]|uniref:fumarylacetoacetate hydrolase family protein n=1 Tax=Acinetobacter baumannii TaxID=470 RepID=UPI0018A6D780|nr:fumarylacetoacetate hydrolase family protein [Acinetobacter baumannii]MBF8340894.1 fumarylacetoacetate hydrolase family protein [Acinetobacter baumannii]MBH8273132.1 fumarylacetoacetate hydrolase family protein [Acinetobacter baumannii]MBH8347563.1 fumarylacetoacetate hydrolase family protein [Acinetobacter baumannii]MBH8434468.1 fumarylacetoacetate hydrolase family protein [Acinetobacter baumannii]MCL8297194.1 fumarylacetoacetate hydrolase family protein [Acinetobacter baumannii]
MNFTLNSQNSLPDDATQGCLIGRAWIPSQISGPSPIILRGNQVFDISEKFHTISELLESTDPLKALSEIEGRQVGSIDELFANTVAEPDKNKAYFLAPIDLQVIKAAGVTFAASMLERVIEEQAGGDAQKAQSIREVVQGVIGDNLKTIEPGSEKALQLKEYLIEQKMWSQYLEVGIGTDAEIFTKAPVLAAVGTGQNIGIHPKSEWNNPEPEVVLVANSQGKILGATLGNDVNLRDFEGRSALLLSKAKDNNASCAIGPFIRLFDHTFTLNDIRTCDVELQIQGTDNFVLNGVSSMSQISRDPEDLIQQTLNENHQYPDGFVLFLGTLFAPTQDREQAGAGFTHKVGDVVRIHSPKLGTLYNKVMTSDKATPWNFGINALMRNLKQRELL